MTSITRFFVLAALLATPALAEGSKPAKPATSLADAEKAFADGVAAMEAANWAAGEKAFRSVLELEPELAEAHNNLGYVLRKQGKDHWDEALRHYDRALELDPKLAAALHYRGVLHVLAGREAKARADHGTLAALDPAMADRLMKVIATGEEPSGADGRISSW